MVDGKAKQVVDRMAIHVMVMVRRPAAAVNLEANHHTHRHCTHHQAPPALALGAEAGVRVEGMVEGVAAE